MSYLRRDPLPPAAEWDRHDPTTYDPAPLDWSELRSPWLWLAAVAVVLGAGAAMWLIVAVVPAS